MRQGGTSLYTNEDPSHSSATSCDHLEAKATYRACKYAVFLDRIKTDLFVMSKEYEVRANFIVNNMATIDSDTVFVSIK